ncbi:flagellar export chaperone FliS [Desertibacillus haloalkaliphilus]|nr:flagellar export chaperone FliS [Desertibacillus haloalkaliphilus]
MKPNAPKKDGATSQAQPVARPQQPTATPQTSATSSQQATRPAAQQQTQVGQTASTTKQANANPYASYQQKAMNTVSPGELTLKLYNGCLKFIRQAKTAINENDIEARNTNLTKAQNIIRELMITLKTDTEVAQNMLRMYDFILNQLVEANVKNDLEALSQAETFVEQFRDTWKEVIKIDRQNRHGAGEQA